MLFIYALLEKTESRKKTRTQAWLDRIAFKGVSPGRAKEFMAVRTHGKGILAWEEIHSSVSQRQGNYDISS